MKLWDRIEGRCDNFRKVDEFGHPGLAFTVELTTPVFDPARYLEKYTALLRLAVPFWIDPHDAGGNYRVAEAFKTAQRTMAYALFEDARPMLLRLRTAVENGDRREADVVMTEMERLFRGD